MPQNLIFVPVPRIKLVLLAKPFYKCYPFLPVSMGNKVRAGDGLKWFLFYDFQNRLFSGMPISRLGVTPS